jgi:hypothetical protein
MIQYSIYPSRGSYYAKQEGVKKYSVDLPRPPRFDRLLAILNIYMLDGDDM